MRPDSPRQLPVSVLTGFLGSGKTTVLNHLIRQPELSRTLVLINEFGEIGLDHDLVARSNEEMVIEMSSGCLCCTIRGDLARTLATAHERLGHEGQPSFDRVVIETTGLADPAPILHTLMTELVIAKRYRLDGVITVVDAVNGSDTLERQAESAKQAAVADRLLLTKADLAGPDTLRDLQDRLREINPATPQIIVERGAVDPDLVLNAGLFDPTTKTPDVVKWLKAEAYNGAQDREHHHDHDFNHQHDVNRHDSHIRACCITIDDPIRGDAFEAWLELLFAFRGADFLRVKGIINVAELERPLVIHGVQHIFHPPVELQDWPSDDRRSRIVFITRDIHESTLRNTLRVAIGGAAKEGRPSANEAGDKDNAVAEVPE